MLSETFKEAFATTASICTVLQFLAGVLVCRKIVANGSTGDASGLAFVSCFMSCSLWLRYGLLINDLFIVLVNVFGTTLQLGYIIVFMLYSLKKSVILKQFSAAVCLVSTIYLYTMLDVDRSLVTRQIGFLSSILTIIFFASPLTMLTHVIKVKSAESLPFPVIVASLIVSCQWFIYGCMLSDPFIQLPNFMGCVLSLFQLSLFLIYPNTKSGQINLV